MCVCRVGGMRRGEEERKRKEKKKPQIRAGENDSHTIYIYILAHTSPKMPFQLPDVFQAITVVDMDVLDKRNKAPN